MKFIKLSILICVLFTCSSFCVAGLAQEQIVIHNETISFSPLFAITNTCNASFSKVFHIQRENYTSESEPFNISYVQTINGTNTNESCTITKTINKYTESQTGYIPLLTNGSYTLRVHIQPNTSNKVLEWKFNLTCGKMSNISINTTNTNNTTTNNTINITTLNETNPEIPTEEDETNEEFECVNTTKIYTNKDIYKPQEKATIQFYLNPIPETFNITYWIENLKEERVKSAYTTNNLNQKTYTFKTQEVQDQGYIIKAVVDDGCTLHPIEKLVIVHQNTSEETMNTSIYIEKTSIEKNNLLIHLILKKGDTAKSVITINAVNEEHKKIAEEQKIKILTKESELESTLNIPIEEVCGNITITISGLGEYKEKTIQKTCQIQDIEKTTVETSSKKEEKQEETDEKRTPTLQTITFSKDNLTPLQEKIVSSNVQKSHSLRNYILAGLGALLIGLVVGLGPKKAFELVRNR